MTAITTLASRPISRRIAALSPRQITAFAWPPKTALSAWGGCNASTLPKNSAAGVIPLALRRGRAVAQPHSTDHCAVIKNFHAVLPMVRVRAVGRDNFAAPLNTPLAAKKIPSNVALMGVLGLHVAVQTLDLVVAMTPMMEEGAAAQTKLAALRKERVEIRPIVAEGRRPIVVEPAKLPGVVEGRRPIVDSSHFNA